MSELINQIKLFRSLKLQPVSGKELKIWEREIENNLIDINNIKDCYVIMNQEEIKASNIENQPSNRVLRLRKKNNKQFTVMYVKKKQHCERVLRQQKKKKCCSMCY